MGLPSRKAAARFWGGLLLAAGLVSLAFSQVVTVVPPEARARSRRTRAQADLAQLERALALYRLDHVLGRVQEPQPQRLEYLIPEYLEELPRDPWGQPYVYLPSRDPEQGEAWTLLCLGGGDPDCGVVVDSRFPHPRPLATPRPTAPALAPSGDVSDLLPPLLSAGLAGLLGTGVWVSSRLRGLRRLRGHAEGLLRALHQVRRPAPSVALRPRPAPVHCAWCRDDAGDAGLLLCCPGCATALHRECWGLAGRCPTLGCRRGHTLARAAAASLTPAPGATISLSPLAATGGAT